MSLNVLDSAKSSGPETRGFDEERSEKTTSNTQEHKDKQLEEPPVGGVANLEYDDLRRPIRVEELQCQRGSDTAKECSK
jgi:hypothetical protein